MQRELLDLLFKNYYDLFGYIFQETDEIEPNLKRDIFKNCSFYYCPNFHEDDEHHKSECWPTINTVPSIIVAGQ